MRSLVVYESMYGTTHHVAEAIGDGLRSFGEVTVASVHLAGPELLDGVDLVVVGGPTHTHGMSHASTRSAAADAVDAPDNDLELDPDAAGDGVREWLESLGATSGKAAAFDTRVDMAAVLSGRASKGIAKKLHAHGFDLIAPPESFLVTKDTHLEPGEDDRARAWAAELGVAAGGAPNPGSR